MSENLEIALEYASYGWAVFPIHPGWKEKFYEYPEYVNPETGSSYSWMYQASSEPDRVRRFWTEHPDANIGVATGDASGGLICIDMDVKNGKNGIAEFDRYASSMYMFFGPTCSAQTPSGGKHLFFKAEKHLSIKGSEDWLPGVDIRANGNYVVVSPSSIDGNNYKKYQWNDARCYEWILDPGECQPLSEADDEAVEMFLEILENYDTEGAASGMKLTEIRRTDAGKVPEGCRHSYVVKLCGELVNKLGALVSDEAILELVVKDFSENCENIHNVNMSDFRRKYLKTIAKFKKRREDEEGRKIDYSYGMKAWKEENPGREFAPSPEAWKEVEAAERRAREARKTFEAGKSQTGQRDPPEKEVTTKMDFDLMPLVSVEDLLAKEIPEPVIYVGDSASPLLSEGITVLAAPPKIGKSWFCVHLAAAILTGSDFLGFHTRPAHVHYYDLEQSEGIRKKRISLALHDLQIEHPKGFYTQEKLQRIGHGFQEQIEYDLKNDPEIGVFIIDVFVKVENTRRNTETEYQWTYRNFTPINELAKKYHVSFILVLHTRKGNDPDRPFDNILGSTANQGAANHMIVLAKDKYSSETIHLVAQGRETEGVIELDYAYREGKLVLSDPEKDQPEDLSEFMESEIRDAIVKFMVNTARWKGKCQGLIDECARQGIGLDASPKQLGAFLSKNSGRFMKHDKILVETRKDGNAGKTYVLCRSDAINSENDGSIIGTIGEWRPIIGPTVFDPA